MAGQMGPEVIEVGKKNYDIYCAVCHGANGNGVSEVGNLMPVKPRNFLLPEVKKLNDARYYSAIVNGYGLMGSYSNQILKKEDRWAIVNYVRMLQKQAGQ